MIILNENTEKMNLTLMNFLGEEIVSSEEELPLEEEDWPEVLFDFLNFFWI
jgi:hypothetical protein